MYVLRRFDGDRAEFLLVSLWVSIDAVRAFAGEDVGTAVFYPEDEAFLIDRETTANHYDVLESP